MSLLFWEVVCFSLVCFTIVLKHFIFFPKILLQERQSTSAVCLVKFILGTLCLLLILSLSWLFYSLCLFESSNKWVIWHLHFIWGRSKDADSITVSDGADAQLFKKRYLSRLEQECAVRTQYSLSTWKIWSSRKMWNSQPGLQKRWLTVRQKISNQVSLKSKKSTRSWTVSKGTSTESS